MVATIDEHVHGVLMEAKKYTDTHTPLMRPSQALAH